MARLHLRYREDGFDPHIVELTSRFIDARPWRGGLKHRDENRYRKFDTWLHGACIVYGLPHVKLTVSPQPGQVGRYVPATDTELAQVFLHRFSVVSLFHQFRHHMQAHAEKNVYKNEEQEAQDAQAWAASLYYVVSPRKFRKAVRAGRISGVHPPDLLKTRRAVDHH